MAIKIIAHRGHTAKNPENTLSAFIAALNAGADAIELDVHAAKDGTLVVHHDYYLGNPDNGTGLILDKNSGYIKRLTIGSTEHIPTLEEVFKIIGSKLHYELELKGCTNAFLTKILDFTNKYNLLQKIEFTSSHTFALVRIKQLDPQCKTGMFVPQKLNWMDNKLCQTLAINNALLGGIDVLHCPLEIIDSTFIKTAHSHNLIVHISNCDAQKDLKQAFKLGIDQLSTNKLDLALALRPIKASVLP